MFFGESFHGGKITIMPTNPTRAARLRRTPTDSPKSVTAKTSVKRGALKLRDTTWLMGKNRKLENNRIMATNPTRLRAKCVRGIVV